MAPSPGDSCVFVDPILARRLNTIHELANFDFVCSASPLYVLCSPLLLDGYDCVPDQVCAEGCDILLPLCALRRLSTSSGSLAKVTWTTFDSTNTCIARLFASENLRNNEARELLCRPSECGYAAAISPLLAFNLGVRVHYGHGLVPEALSAALGLVPCGNKDAWLKIEAVKAAIPLSILTERKYASFVQIAKVAVPTHHPFSASEPSASGAAPAPNDTEQQPDTGSEALGNIQADIKPRAVLCLEQHFKDGPRYLRPGDVLAVRLSQESAQNLQPPQPTTLASDTITFIVQSMQPETLDPLLVDCQKADIALQARTACSLLPVGVPGYLHDMQLTCCGFEPTRHEEAPALRLGEHLHACSLPAPHLAGVSGALRPTWRQVAALLAPLLHPASAHVDLHVSLLVHGPRGSGRRTAVRAAAAALGMHCVPWSAYDIAGSSDAKTQAALRAAVSDAQRFSPCVLLVRHLEVLGRAAAAQEPRAAAAVSQLAVLLTELMASHCTSAARSCLNRAAAQQPPSSTTSGVTSGAVEGGAAPVSAGLVVVVGFTERLADVAVPLARCFTHELEVEAPGREELGELLGGMLGAAARQLSREELQASGMQLAGLVPAEVRAVAADAALAAVAQNMAALEAAPDPSTPAAASTAGGCCPPPAPAVLPPLAPQHLSSALSRVKARTATEVGSPQVPNVSWSDVGGLDEVRRCVMDTVELPLKHRHLFTAGLRRRSGILLYGPPGSGKTLLAKAVATQCSANFLSVKGPELINMYVGESERQVREIFARARRAKPCVMFFDELDSLAPARGASGDSGGVMDRVVSQLLAEIDGVQGGGDGAGDDLFVIAATNRPDLLDPALLRPGRLDVLVYVGIAKRPQDKLHVLQALTRKFHLAPDVDLPAIAARCSPLLTGADLYALCADAWMIAMRQAITQEEERAQSGGLTDEEATANLKVVVRGADLMQALSNLVPSLSASQVAEYERVREQYESRSKT